MAKDETCTHVAVKLVRDTFRFCPNLYWREAIIVTAEQSMELWVDVIREWKKPFYDQVRGKNQKNGRNPLDYSKMCSEFERRYHDEPQWKLPVKNCAPVSLNLGSLTAVIEYAEKTGRPKR